MGESSTTINRLAAPPIGSPTLHIGGLLIDFQTTIAGANRYQARLVVDGVPQQTTVDISATDIGLSYMASFPITEATPGTDFKVQVRALGANALPSPWATGAQGRYAPGDP